MEYRGYGHKFWVLEDRFSKGFAYESVVHLTLSQNLDSQVRISWYGSIKTLEIETLDTVGTPRYRVYGRTPSELGERDREVCYLFL